MSDLLRVVDSAGDFIVADTIEDGQGDSYIRIRVVDTGDSEADDIELNEVWLTEKVLLDIADKVRKPVEDTEPPRTGRWVEVEFNQLASYNFKNQLRVVDSDGLIIIQGSLNSVSSTGTTVTCAVIISGGGLDSAQVRTFTQNNSVGLTFKEFLPDEF